MVRSCWRFWSQALLLTLLLVSQASGQERAGKKYALVVGVNRYEDRQLGSLRFAVQDARDLTGILLGGGYRVITLTDDAASPKARPTRANILRCLDWVLAQLGPHDTMVLGLSGHGAESQKTQEGYFCPADCRTNDAETLLSMTAVYDRLGKAPGLKFLFVDACRTDPGGRTLRGLTTVARTPQGLAALFSCSPGQCSHENENLKHGIFFYHLLSGLRGEAQNGDGEVTWDRLAEYVRSRVDREARTPQSRGPVQQPNAVANLIGESPVLFTRVRREIADAMALLRRHETRLGLDPGETAFLRENAAECCQLWIAEASRGLPQAQILYALCLKHGIGAEKNEAAALTWLQKAATQGSTHARVALGLLYWSSRGTPSQMTKQECYLQALRYFKEAAKQGNAGAQNNVGLLYENGQGVSPDLTEAMRWYRKAADQGLVVAQLNLGRAHEQNRDMQQAAQWYYRAATHGSARGQYLLGKVFRTYGDGGKDAEEGLRWLQRAAERGNPDAQNDMGVALAQEGTAKSLAEAVRWYRKAADQGYVTAQVNLGVALLRGRGTPKNEARAVEYFEMAAARGNAQGLFQLALCYQNGTGKAKNALHAAQLYRRAAEKGYAPAMTNYGLSLERSNPEQAFIWYEKAAAKGSTAAMVNLGNFYRRNVGLTRSLPETQRYAEALRLYEKAAAEGDPRGQYALGLMYENGWGIARSPTRAREQYQRAARQGYELAQKKLQS